MEHNSEIEVNASTDSGSTSNGLEGISLGECTLLRLLRQGIIETTEENSVFGKEISKLLQEVGINCRTLPDDIREGLQKVSLILKLDHLLDIDGAVQCTRQGEQMLYEKKKQREEKVVKLKQDMIYKKCLLLQKKAELLEQAVNSLTMSIESEKINENTVYSNKILLSKKSKDYQHTLEKLQSELDKMDIAELCPEIIETKYRQYLETLGELTELDQCIAKYKELPPNLLQAKALLQSKEKEYNEISEALLEKTK